MNVAFLTNVVSPYRRPVFEQLGRTPGWRLTVLANAHTEFDRAWSETGGEHFELVVSKSLAFRRRHVSHAPVRTEQVVTRYLPIGLWRDLSRRDPAVVITHELGPRSLIAAAWCRAHRRPYVVWSYQSRAGAAARGVVRRLVRAAVLSRAAAVVGMGRQAREVLEGYGVDAARIVDAPNASDTRLLLARLARSRADGTCARLAESLGAGRRIALVSGRLVPFKGIERLLAMWRTLPADLRAEWTLVFVGDGPLAPLVDAAHEVGVQRCRAVPMAEIADWYGAADLLVFPSLADCWGLVVNEAMLCGVPALCSVHAGCADDLIDDGRDGLLFDPTDPVAGPARLAAALRRTDLGELGARAAETGAGFTIERLAAGFRTAVERALGARATSTTAIPAERVSG